MENLGRTVLAAVDPALAIRSNDIELSAPDLNINGLTSKMLSFSDSLMNKMKMGDKEVNSTIETAKIANSSKVKTVNDEESIKTNSKLNDIRDLSVMQLAETKRNRTSQDIIERRKIDNSIRLKDKELKFKKTQNDINTRTTNKIAKDTKGSENTSETLTRMLEINEKLFDLAKYQNEIESDSGITRSKITTNIQAEKRQEKNFRNTQLSLLRGINKNISTMLEVQSNVSSSSDIMTKVIVKNDINNIKDKKDINTKSSVLSSMMGMLATPFKAMAKSGTDYINLQKYRLKRVVEDYQAKYVEDRIADIQDRLEGGKGKGLSLLTRGFFTSIMSKFVKLDSTRFGKDVFTSMHYKDVNWNSKDHSALTVVIPTWLSKIFKALTGRSEVWDYRTGTFREAKEMFNASEREREIELMRAQKKVEFLQRNNRDVAEILKAKDELREAQKKFNAGQWDDLGSRSAVLNIVNDTLENGQTTAQKASFTKLHGQKIKSEKEMAEVEKGFRTYIEGMFSFRVMDTLKKTFHNNKFFEDIQFISDKRLYTENDTGITKFITKFNKFFNNLGQTEIKYKEQIESLKDYYTTNEGSIGAAVRRNVPKGWSKYLDENTDKKEPSQIGISVYNEDMEKSSNTLMLIYKLLLNKFNADSLTCKGSRKKYKDESQNFVSTLEKKKKEREAVKAVVNEETRTKESVKQTTGINTINEQSKSNTKSIIDAIRKYSDKNGKGIFDTLISLGTTIGSSILGVGKSIYDMFLGDGLGGKKSILDIFKNFGGLLIGGVEAGAYAISKVSKIVTGVFSSLKSFLKKIPFLGAFFDDDDVNLDKNKLNVGKKTFFKRVLSKIPVIGALIGGGYALDYLMDGKLELGFYQLASTIASMFPGVGTALSLAIDEKIANLESGGLINAVSDAITPDNTYSYASNLSRHSTDSIVDSIKDKESYQGKFYEDGEGDKKGVSIGYGHWRKTKEENLDSLEKILGYRPKDELTKSEAEIVLANDINETTSTLFKRNPWLKDTPIAVKNDMIDMAYNLGVSGLEEMKGFKSVKEGNFLQAAKEFQNTKWYTQVGNRAKTIVSDLVQLGGGKVGSEYIPNSINNAVQDLFSSTKDTVETATATINENIASEESISKGLERLRGYIKKGDDVSIAKMLEETTPEMLEIKKAYFKEKGDNDYSSIFNAKINGDKINIDDFKEKLNKLNVSSATKKISDSLENIYKKSDEISADIGLDETIKVAKDKVTASVNVIADKSKGLTDTISKSYQDAKDSVSKALKTTSDEYNVHKARVDWAKLDDSTLVKNPDGSFKFVKNKDLTPEQRGTINGTNKDNKVDAYLEVIKKSDDDKSGVPDIKSVENSNGTDNQGIIEQLKNILNAIKDGNVATKENNTTVNNNNNLPQSSVIINNTSVSSNNGTTTQTSTSTESKFASTPVSNYTLRQSAS